MYTPPKSIKKTSDNRRRVAVYLLLSCFLHIGVILMSGHRTKKPVEQAISVTLQKARDEPERFRPALPDVLPEVEMEQLVVEKEAPKVDEEVAVQETSKKGQKLIARQEEFLDLSTLKLDEYKGEVIRDTSDKKDVEEAVRQSFEQVSSTILKEPDKRIDMKKELLNLSALDFGKYKGMAIQSTTNKQDVEGFVHLSLIWGTFLQPSRQQAVTQLVEAINTFTQIEAKVDKHTFLDSPTLLKYPFVLITAKTLFELTDAETRRLAVYLRKGGFVVADGSIPATPSLKAMFKQTLGKDAQWLPIPNDHPIYHSFFDSFDGGPPLPGATMDPIPVDFLEGIFLMDRLVAVFTPDYGGFWEQQVGTAAFLAHLRLGINLVVFALTQEGSIAQQQVDFYKHAMN